MLLPMEGWGRVFSNWNEKGCGFARCRLGGGALKHPFYVIVAAVFFIQLFGCSIPSKFHMEFDSSIGNSSKHYSVVTKNKFFDEDKMNVSVGPYQVRNMDIGWRRVSNESGNGTVDLTVANKSIYKEIFVKKDERQSFKYDLLVNGSPLWKVVCIFMGQLKSESTSILNMPVNEKLANNAEYNCSIKSEDNKFSWTQIVINSMSGKVYPSNQSNLMVGDFYQIEASDKIIAFFKDGDPRTGTIPVVAGYNFLLNDVVKASISTVGSTELYLSEDNADVEDQVMLISAINMYFYQEIVVRH